MYGTPLVGNAYEYEQEMAAEEDMFESVSPKIPLDSNTTLCILLFCHIYYLRMTAKVKEKSYPCA
jgi:hypothetical protein